MTDQNQTIPTVDENDAEYRAELLSRAAQMGISVHPNAKNSTIATKIAAHLKDLPIPTDPDNPEPVAVATDATSAPQGDDSASAPTTPAPVEAGPVSKEVHPQKRLHRVIITCNDPQKADQSGDMISVSNSVVGNLRFYFHFNKPWHIPEIVLDTIKESKIFLHSSRRDGRDIVTREAPRYNIQYLPPLTEKELKRIQDKQTAALATED